MIDGSEDEYCLRWGLRGPKVVTTYLSTNVEDGGKMIDNFKTCAIERNHFSLCCVAKWLTILTLQCFRICLVQMKAMDGKIIQLCGDLTSLNCV